MSVLFAHSSYQIYSLNDCKITYEDNDDSRICVTLHLVDPKVLDALERGWIGNVVHQ